MNLTTNVPSSACERLKEWGIGEREVPVTCLRGSATMCCPDATAFCIFHFRNNATGETIDYYPDHPYRQGDWGKLLIECFQKFGGSLAGYERDAWTFTSTFAYAAFALLDRAPERFTELCDLAQSKEEFMMFAAFVRTQ